MPTVHSNPSQRRSFSRTLFKLEESENAGFNAMALIFAGIRLSNLNFKSHLEVKLTLFMVNNYSNLIGHYTN